ncbi:unnamed protein product [Nesidiocoris tenuis]|uniref:Uncharacterized protein n=1 Tax=Nesidiocoris tenuis TaxID=355587 RepID=A0A6H5HN59_9HEMI|nr:unnamed protein product [Nesidiocoris tenuis]
MGECCHIDPQDHSRGSLPTLRVGDERHPRTSRSQEAAAEGPDGQPFTPISLALKLSLSHQQGDALYHCAWQHESKTSYTNGPEAFLRRGNSTPNNNRMSRNGRMKSHSSSSISFVESPRTNNTGQEKSTPRKKQGGSCIIRYYGIVQPGRYSACGEKWKMPVVYELYDRNRRHSCEQSGKRQSVGENPRTRSKKRRGIFPKIKKLSQLVWEEVSGERPSVLSGEDESKKRPEDYFGEEKTIFRTGVVERGRGADNERAGCNIAQMIPKRQLSSIIPTSRFDSKKLCIADCTVCSVSTWAAHSNVYRFLHAPTELDYYCVLPTHHWFVFRT